MARDPLTFIQNVRTLGELISLENNIRKGKAETAEIRDAIERRYADFGRQMVADNTGLELEHLTRGGDRAAHGLAFQVQPALLILPA